MDPEQNLKIMSSGKILNLGRLARHCAQLSTHPARRNFFGPPGRWDPFSDMTTAIREIEKNVGRMERDMDKFWSRSGMDRFLPTFSRMSPIATKDGVHRITMDLSGYKPEDVHVSLKDRVVTVEGKFEQKDEHHRLYQEWSKKYTLPESADLDKMKSMIDSDGVLIIEAPAKGDGKGKPQPTEIPIEKN